MAFSRKQKHELAGGEVIAAYAGLDMKDPSGYGYQFIGVHGTSGMKKLVLIGEIAGS